MRPSRDDTEDNARGGGSEEKRERVSMRECGPIQRGRPCAAECHVCTTSTSSTTPHRGITTHDTTKGRSEDCRPRSPHYTSAGPNRDPRLREGREPKPTDGLLDAMPADTDEEPYKVYGNLPAMKAPEARQGVRQLAHHEALDLVRAREETRRTHYDYYAVAGPNRGIRTGSRNPRRAVPPLLPPLPHECRYETPPGSPRRSTTR